MSTASLNQQAIKYKAQKTSHISNENKLPSQTERNTANETVMAEPTPNTPRGNSKTLHNLN